MIKTINSLVEFQHDAVLSEDLVLVDFYAEWCNPCKHMSGVLDNLLPELEKTFKVYKVNVDILPELALEHQVTTIPTLFVYELGKCEMIDPDVDTEEWLMQSLNKWVNK